MGIGIQPPDINEGESGFSVAGEGIRYGLSAIKSVGRTMVDAIVKERESGGFYTSLDDFVERMGGKELNKRTLENFIKSGALDSLPGNRRQKTMIAPELLEQKNKEKKNSLEGQMSLFDFAGEEEKKQYQIRMPEVEEFPKEELLAFEKEILGVYVSGHPLEEYMEVWKNSITARTTDFSAEEEGGRAVLADGEHVIIGGMIISKMAKTTKTGKMMAFVTIEDLVGTVEVLVFPRDYERGRSQLVEDSKVFVRGRVSMGDDAVGKLILEQVIPFESLPRELWLQFADKAEYDEKQQQVFDILKMEEGQDTVGIFLKKERAKKILPANWRVCANKTILERLYPLLGENNVKLVEKGLKR